MFERKMYRFIGQNGSLGLKKGNAYVIDLKKHTSRKEVVAYIYITNNQVITCPYTSIKTFNENWGLI